MKNVCVINYTIHGVGAGVTESFWYFLIFNGPTLSFVSHVHFPISSHVQIPLAPEIPV